VYVSASFAGSVDVSSKPVEIRGRTDLAGMIMQQILIPVMEPSLTQRVQLKLCDKELQGEVVLGHTYFDFKSLERAGTGLKRNKVIQARLMYPWGCTHVHGCIGILVLTN
jgi:hypothetical protein